MKKILVVLALAATSLTSFGQGYFTFTATAGGAYNGYSTPTSHLSAGTGVAFLWGSGAALITGIQASTPTNATSVNQNWSLSGAWTAILTDPNYHLAIDSGTAGLVSTTTAANSAWSYNTGNTFGVTGTSAQAYNVYVIGWDASTYATPALAAANGVAVGWSSIFSYTAVNNIGTPLSMAASGLTRFGTAAPVPEPSTMVLAGLGIASLALFRRRKA